MAITRLRSPSPRRIPLKLSETPWSTRGLRLLAPPGQPAVTADVFQVLDNRVSRRGFSALTERQLSALLWHSARSRFSYLDATGRRVDSRPAPSAGACHPHDLLVLQPNRRDFAASIYDPYVHALTEVTCQAQLRRTFIRHVNAVLPTHRGTLIWLIAQTQRTASRYDYPESLLWRDAGVLLGVMAIVAESLGLSFCPVGVTGDPSVSALMGVPRAGCGFGGAIVGGSPPPASRPRRSRAP
jgi:SagB-type dehydrogenase family enzyme